MSSLPPEDSRVIVWQPGDKLFGDRYTIERVLGMGGFGVTYLATDQQSRRIVIKTLNEIAQRSPKFAKYRQDFQEEARKLGYCRHPHIVQIESSFQEGQLPCIAMEYIEGEDLWQRVEKLQKPLSESEALLYIQQIASALTAVHQKGLLHRDVKPQNIMVRSNQEEVILIDFGIAKEFIPDKTQRHTEAYTHGFSPLEQYDEEARHGDYIDVYSLAATLYYLLTTKVPPSAWARVSRDSLKPPQQENPNISDSVNRAILMGMSLYVKDRPQSVQDWLDLFQNSRRVLVNYQKLEELLVAKKWQAADKETAAIMLKICDRQEEGWLQLEDIKKIPCDDFRTIDKLWVEHSKGRFGFSVQNRIWERIGGNPDANDKTWERFGERVGWRVKVFWIESTNFWLDIEHLKLEWFKEIYTPEWDLVNLIKWLVLFPLYIVVYFSDWILLIFMNLSGLILRLKLTLMPKEGYLPKTIKPYTGIIIGRGAKVVSLNLQEDLAQFRQATAVQIAHQIRIEKQYNDAQNEANKWHRNSELAQQKGDESLTQMALDRHQSYIYQANKLQLKLEQERAKLERSRRKLLYQEFKVDEAKIESNWEIAALAEKLAECNIS
ncbi:GUN4 domain-containing protein [Nostoc sp. C117]|uniref:protein kinase domain-containing protein n=1 Tax=Nostoc sp. C117 TaxID=3349875 RepID=UPI00370D103C